MLPWFRGGFGPCQAYLNPLLPTRWSCRDGQPDIIGASAGMCTTCTTSKKILYFCHFLGQTNYIPNIILVGLS
jgi:hypothetical protein